jgi:hypothetical protein
MDSSHVNMDDEGDAVIDDDEVESDCCDEESVEAGFRPLSASVKSPRLWDGRIPDDEASLVRDADLLAGRLLAALLRPLRGVRAGDMLGVSVKGERPRSVWPDLENEPAAALEYGAKFNFLANRTIVLVFLSTAAPWATL